MSSSPKLGHADGQVNPQNRYCRRLRDFFGVCYPEKSLPQVIIYAVKCHPEVYYEKQYHLSKAMVYFWSGKNFNACSIRIHLSRSIRPTCCKRGSLVRPLQQSCEHITLSKLA